MQGSKRGPSVGSRILFSSNSNSLASHVSFPVALVGSRHDHCNVLCVGLRLKTAWKLPLVQNAAGCLLAGAGRNGRISTDSHFLSVPNLNSGYYL